MNAALQAPLENTPMTPGQQGPVNSGWPCQRSWRLASKAPPRHPFSRRITRINVRADEEVRHWCRKWRVTASRLKVTVYKVGPLAKHVARRLGN
ncbi:MAG: DUF3606 domain-containing protein [Alphaproteobacteria bacterium]|nr:DUF3606 domain-containing protein [Alphaproteobacteria bacterium]